MSGKYCPTCYHLPEIAENCPTCGRIATQNSFIAQMCKSLQPHNRDAETIDTLTRQLAEATQERDALQADAEKKEARLFHWFNYIGRDQWGHEYGQWCDKLDAEIAARKETK